jgi:hypothetical protein
MNKRLEKYFYEAKKHKEHIIEAKEELNTPICSYATLPKLEKFAMNTLIFRFSKLQDLIGAKIFRAYLEYHELSTNEFSFFDILKEIEKEGIIDIDSWSELREIRNDIAHDYPEEFDEMIEKLNLLIDKSDELLGILERLEERYNETKQQRD